jgi:hypothetical protein
MPSTIERVEVGATLYEGEGYGPNGEGEIYELPTEGGGGFIGVYALRQWCRTNARAVPVNLDREWAEGMVERGTVSLEHIMAHTLRREFEPIIVGRQIVPPFGDKFIDGKHRYVAAALGLAMTQLPGFIQGYVLQPEQWRPFLVSGIR